VANFLNSNLKPNEWFESGAAKKKVKAAANQRREEPFMTLCSF